MPTRKGAIRLFGFAGINVYLHWAWFVAFLYLSTRPNNYPNYGWNALEIVALFAIVLMHEFGHQLACRQVGGKTHDIVLWPLGGVAYVSPPQRPGAQLWSIAAGPLVNVVLIPILSLLVAVSSHLAWYDTMPNVYTLVHNIWVINIVLLVFNMMPVYPLDGGQILRSILWFIFGRANSLLAASIIGFVGVALLIGIAIIGKSVWMGIMSAFILMSCWSGLMQARALAKIARIPRRPGFACPSCHSQPPLGAVWRCGNCAAQFDTFVTNGLCPNCNATFPTTQCLDCGERHPINEWYLQGQKQNTN